MIHHQILGRGTGRQVWASLVKHCLPSYRSGCLAAGCRSGYVAAGCRSGCGLRGGALADVYEEEMDQKKVFTT